MNLWEWRIDNRRATRSHIGTKEWNSAELVWSVVEKSRKYKTES